MSKSNLVRYALGSIQDLTIPTSTQKYRLGEIVKIEDSDKKVIKKYMYVKSHGTLTQYGVYALDFSGTAAAEVLTKATVTAASLGQFICIPQVGFTSGYYGFVQIYGDCKAICTSETIAAGDYLQVLTTAAVLNVDGTSGATARVSTSVAISKDAAYAATGNNVVLLGRWTETAGA